MTSVSPTAPNPSSPTKVALYFGPLTLLIYLVMPHSYFVDFVTAYLLKNQLHISADQIALFRLLTAIPVYLAFVFGMVRDLWNPFGLRDRGYFMIFAPAAAVVFVWMAFSHLTYLNMVIGMVLVMTLFRLVAAAYQGLMALVGQEQLMSGRLAVLWSIVLSIPAIAGGFAVGPVVEYLSPRGSLLLFAGITLLIGAFGLWKSRAVFSHAYDQPIARGTNLWGDIKRLVHHRAVYPAVLTLFLFQFAPGSNTPLQFYLTNHLHASDAIYGDFNAIFSASFVPVFFLYGFICKKVSLQKLLWWGTIISVPQMIPLAFIHSSAMALWLAVPIGAMGGIAAAAYYDLAMRACPPGLQGTLMMMVDGFSVLSARAGDVLGTWIYDASPEHGFLYCVIAITVVYALILPVLLLIPKDLINTADGQMNPALEADLVRETFD